MEAKLISLVKKSIKINMDIYKDLNSPETQQFEKLPIINCQIRLKKEK